MVSLIRNVTASSGGGVFFNDSSVDCDTQQLEPIIGNDDIKKFRPLRTVGAIVFQMCLSILLSAGGVALTSVWPKDRDKCEVYFILLYVHAVFWSISFIIHHFVKNRHIALKVGGYIEFHQAMYKLARLPFYIVSLWNGLLLVISVLFQHLFHDIRHQCDIPDSLSPNNYVCLIIALESAVLTICSALYISKVVEFNRKKPVPDVQREEWMVNLIQDSHTGGEIGYRERGDDIQDLLEKQADVIYSLKEQNSKLSQKIMTLTTLLHHRAPA